VIAESVKHRARKSVNRRSLRRGLGLEKGEAIAHPAEDLELVAASVLMPDWLSAKNF